jgi:hypothetical protein
VPTTRRSSDSRSFRQLASPARRPAHRLPPHVVRPRHGLPRQRRAALLAETAGRSSAVGRAGHHRPSPDLHLRRQSDPLLPDEVGLSYFPVTAPSLNVRLRGLVQAYLKAATQRSLDAAGNQSTADRNPSGFRFRPPGSGVLPIGEVGYQRPSSAASPQAWLRAGYMRNSTAYANRLTGQPESGNYCAYVLMDYQLRRPDPATPGRGFYLGGTAMTVPSEFNAYGFPHRHVHPPCRAWKLPEPEPGLRAGGGALAARRRRAHVHRELEPVPVDRGPSPRWVVPGARRRLLPASQGRSRSRLARRRGVGAPSDGAGRQTPPPPDAARFCRFVGGRWYAR